jgi:hypothetical protein
MLEGRVLAELARRLLLVATVAVLWLACAPSGLGGTCRFSGDDSSPCGMCIAANCQAQVNTCCGDDWCASRLGALDECATGSSCTSLASTDRALAECVAASCAMCDQAGGTDAGARDSGPKDSEPRFKSNCSSPDNYGCICSPAGGGDTVCNETAVNDGICCADRGWPAAGTLCTCKPFTCEQVFGSPFVELRCELEDLHTGISEGTGPLCCLGFNTCKCGPSDMGCDDEDVVPRCASSVMPCGSSKTRVDSCSYE